MTPDHIKQVAIKLIKSRGLENLSRSILCAHAGVPPGSFTHVMGLSFKAFISALAAEGHGSTGNPEVTRRRIDPTLRRKHIVRTAHQLITQGKKLTREAVATAAGVSESTVSKYFGTMNQLQRAVARLQKQSRG